MAQIRFLNVEYIFQKGYELLVNQDFTGLFYIIFAALLSFVEAIRPVSLILSVVLVIGIVYCHIRIKQIREQEKSIYGLVPQEVAPEQIANKKWQRIHDHVNSANESDWRLAILEADIILDEMLESMGYRGETMSDKLKAVEKSDFLTIDSAWEAHKIRNQIAHEGAAFRLNQREALRVIGLYEEVFREFKYI
ncbi:MAG: hypothetical protein Q8P86_04105 [bacterium]|nr:hypothetical protein [bacterium]